MDAKEVLKQLRLKHDTPFLEPFYMEVEFDFFDDNRYAGRILIVAIFSDKPPCQMHCGPDVSIEIFKIIDVLLDEEHLINMTTGAPISSRGSIEILEKHIDFVLKEELLCIKRIMNQQYINCLLKK